MHRGSYTAIHQGNTNQGMNQLNVEFNPRFFVGRRFFKTDSMHFNIYCIEPGQSNPLHKHSGSDEICYFVQGTDKARSFQLSPRRLKVVHS